MHLAWKLYVNYDSASTTETRSPQDIEYLFPGPITNQTLQDPELPEDLRPNLRESTDFVFLSDRCYGSLQKLFGGTKISSYLTFPYCVTFIYRISS